MSAHRFAVVDDVRPCVLRGRDDPRQHAALRPRAVRDGAPRVAAAVKAEPVIKRGDPVVIEAGSAGFSISREGTALTDAAPGARFTVRVEDAKAPVQAVAVAQGRATLPGWGE